MYFLIIYQFSQTHLLNSKTATPLTFDPTSDLLICSNTEVDVLASIISETLGLRCPRRVPSDVPNGDVTSGEGAVSVQTDVPTRGRS